MRMRNDPCDLGQPLNKVKENRSVGESGKVNPALLYRNELDPEKWIITQEFYGQQTPKGPSMEKYELIKMNDFSSDVHHHFCIFKISFTML